MPPQLVEHDLGGRVALEIDDDAHAMAVGFVADVADALDALVLGGFGDLFDQAVLADLIGDFRQYDRAAVATAFLDVVARALHDRPAPSRVGAADARQTEDEAASREVRALHM